MENPTQASDDQAIQQLDQSWNDVYIRNDRTAFAYILADDFCGTFPDGRTASKQDMMQSTPNGARVSFSERRHQLFTPTAVTRGRVRIELPDRLVDQRYVRVYAKRSKRWQAVAVFVFPATSDVGPATTNP